MPTNTISVEANPRKGLFINMLTRDINLIDCILDLIDNSIDSILDKTNFDPMKALSGQEKKKLNTHHIVIKFNEKEFSIEDDSGGVTRDDAVEKVFRFGSENTVSKKLGLSVYGVGMKRAFFKIGKLIDFESVSRDGLVSVKIDVEKWVKKPEWNLEGEFTPKPKNKTFGTKIIIKNITEEVKPSFENQAFQIRLIEKIQTTYGLFLSRGLVIKINDKKAEPDIPTILKSDKLKPTSKVFKKNGVQIKIIAGISNEEDKTSNGWYIFCNGRLILEGDKTANTGWGNGLLRKFHPSINRFVGFVYFRSDSVNLLPWTTTKNGVNFESEIYQYGLIQMVKIAQPIVTFLANQYNKDRNTPRIKELAEAAKNVPLSELKGRDSIFMADINSAGKKNQKAEIAYSVPIKDLDKVKKLMENEEISNSDIGEATFYYYLEHEE